jgi:hypothetical protein
MKSLHNNFSINEETKQIEIDIGLSIPMILPIGYEIVEKDTTESRRLEFLRIFNK